MGTPDMSDVTRLVDADDPAPEVIERVRAALVAIVEHQPEMRSGATAEDCKDCDAAQERRWPPSGLCDEHYRRLSNETKLNQHAEAAQHWSMRGIARDALKALEAITSSGYALVRLPEPSVGSYTWEATKADEYHWAAVADVDEKGPYVRVRLAEREIDSEMAMRFALGVYAAAVRSVAQHAAELADEHNTAVQGAEEGGTDGN